MTRIINDYSPDYLTGTRLIMISLTVYFFKMNQSDRIYIFRYIYIHPFLLLAPFKVQTYSCPLSTAKQPSSQDGYWGYYIPSKSASNIPLFSGFF